MDYSSKVRAIRHYVGLSQAKFSNKLGISVRTIENWEMGIRTPTGAAKFLIDHMFQCKKLKDSLKKDS